MQSYIAFIFVLREKRGCSRESANESGAVNLYPMFYSRADFPSGQSFSLSCCVEIKMLCYYATVLNLPLC